jgi:hypothetical protein
MSLVDELRTLLLQPTGLTSAGHPYLPAHAWIRFRDWIPHLLGDAPAVLSTVDLLEDELGASVTDAARVLRQVVKTAQVTAPPDLWLLRHVLCALDQMGLLEALRRGHVITATAGGAIEDELRIDLDFLLSRGILIRQGDGWRSSDTHSARSALALSALPPHWPTNLGDRWCHALQGTTSDLAILDEILSSRPPAERRQAPMWMPTGEDIEVGWRLLPLVLGCRAAGRIAPILDRGQITAADLSPLPPPMCASALALFAHCGACDADGTLTTSGARMLSRGPGPFGIIEAYHPYMRSLPRVLREGRGAVHVSRGTNVAASQDANRRTFERANQALDRYCTDTGFTFSLFIEHAVGRGEAIRQRWAIDGEAVAYVGVDLEAEALAATDAERVAGVLPETLHLIRADIGQPTQLIEALHEAALDPSGAVMVVGNGFHEVRNQTDDRMVEVLQGYAKAGIVLLFTEESALTLDDLLHTAWNTYHAGFRYVHLRSGQGLRPATPQPPSRLGQSLPASWAECAERAGYLRLEAYCSRSRTIYPHTPPSGVNPSISVNHFFVPR